MELKHMGYYDDGKYEIVQESISGVLYAMQDGNVVAQGGDMIEIIEVIRNQLENGPRISGTNRDDNYTNKINVDNIPHITGTNKDDIPQISGTNRDDMPHITGTNKDEEYKKALTENSSIEETVPSDEMEKVQKEYANIEEKENNISNEIEQ